MSVAHETIANADAKNETMTAYFEIKATKKNTTGAIAMKEGWGFERSELTCEIQLRQLL